MKTYSRDIITPRISPNTSRQVISIFNFSARRISTPRVANLIACVKHVTVVTRDRSRDIYSPHNATRDVPYHVIIISRSIHSDT